MTMFSAWRRNPPGALAQTLSNGRLWPKMKTFMNLSDDEFADALRAEGCSDKYIEQEVQVFRLLRAQRAQSTEQATERRERRRNRPVKEAMDPYVEAEIRRLAGAASDDILKDMR